MTFAARGTKISLFQVSTCREGGNILLWPPRTGPTCCCCEFCERSVVCLPFIFCFAFWCFFRAFYFATFFSRSSASWSHRSRLMRSVRISYKQVFRGGATIAKGGRILIFSNSIAIQVSALLDSRERSINFSRLLVSE